VAPGRGPRARAPVFYNPAMAVDRDLAVAFVRARFPGGGGAGWEMLAATGARGLRLVREGPGFRTILLTEANPEAVAVLVQNAAGFPGVRVLEADAHAVPDGAPFEYVDLDPYGSPLSFLDPAVEAVRPGGVLAVTATDLMVLAGVQPGACERRYGARPVRGRLGPEGGLRILLANVARTARRHGRAARPLLAYVRDHHIRLYVEVGEPSGTGDPIGAIDPGTWDGPVVGQGAPFGPLWLGPLFDAALVGRLALPPTAAHPKEVDSFLGKLRGEVEVDRPFYYEANELAAALGLASPGPLRSFVTALAALGYRAAPTHARDGGFRTDAPRSVVESVARSLAGP